MSFCKSCNREMSEVDECTLDHLILDGKKYPRIRYGEGFREDGYDKVPNNCKDCGVGAGMFHHPGCDMEECPKCHDQLIKCQCSTDIERLQLEKKQVETYLTQKMGIFRT